MEPGELKQTPELFVADDILKTAKELQSHLSTISYDEQPAFAAQAIDVLGDPRELYGGKKILVHALGARVLRDFEYQLSFDEELWHGTYFADVYLRASFSRFAYIRSRAISSLCLSLVESNVLRSSSNTHFEGENIKSGMYVPVHSVESVLAA